MPRRDNVISVRVSAETASKLDDVRGGQSRARWVADLIDHVLNAATAAMPTEETAPGHTPTGTTAGTPRAQTACDHPRARVIKGFCYKCGGMVLPK
jgi:hypothetical protein